MPLRSPSTSSGGPAARSIHAEALALHCIFFFTGLGTLVLATILPAIGLRWHLDDRSAGLLLGIQFFGSFLGAVTLGRDPGKNLSAGCAAIVIGFGCVAPATAMPSGFALGACGVFIAGVGLGRTITMINLIAGERFARHRASALSLLNLTWGLGALIGPVAADRTASHFGLPGLFSSLCATNTLVLSGSVLLLRHCFAVRTTSTSEVAPFADRPVVGRKTVIFAIAFLAYGGIEASLSGWISSLTARSTGGTLHLGATATSNLWIGMTAGRAVAALLLLRIRERALLIGALALSGIISVLLLLQGEGVAILVLLALGLGVSLAPVFPSLCSLLLAKAFPMRSIGRVMAATALGSAGFPWLVGIVSAKTGALQNGLWVPVALCVLLTGLVPVIAPPVPAAETEC